MKFWKILLIIIAIIILILLVMVSFGAALPAFMAAIPWISSLFTYFGTLVAAGSWGTLGLIALGALAVADPDSLEAIGEVAGDAAGAVGSAAGDILGGAISGIVSSPVMLIAAAFALWFVFVRDKDAKATPAVQTTKGTPSAATANPDAGDPEVVGSTR